MTEPLAVESGDRTTFGHVLMARDAGLTYLVNEQVAVPPFLMGHRRVVPSVPREYLYPCPEVARDQPADRGTSMDRYSPLRERINSLRGGRLLLLAVLVGPLVMAGYLALTVVLFLPLLGLRTIFRARSTPAVVHWDNDGPRYSGMGTSGTRRSGKHDW
jgi:hypothetical protein